MELKQERGQGTKLTNDGLQRFLVPDKDVQKKGKCLIWLCQACIKKI